MPPSPAWATCPLPPQVVHVVGPLPGLAPLPWQVWQMSSRLNSTSRVAPVSTSGSVSSTSVSRS